MVKFSERNVDHAQRTPARQLRIKKTYSHKKKLIDIRRYLQRGRWNVNILSSPSDLVSSSVQRNRTGWVFGFTSKNVDAKAQYLGSNCGCTQYVLVPRIVPRRKRKKCYACPFCRKREQRLRHLFTFVISRTYS